MRRVLVVINPSSCDFEAERRWPELEPILKSYAELSVLKTDPDDRITTRAIAERLEQPFDRLIAIGGDGTVHLAVNGMMQPKDGGPLAAKGSLPQLGVIPFGTANNVAKSLGLPLADLAELARIAAGDRLGRLDLARVRTKDGTERIFVDSLTIGMDADVLDARRHYRDLGGYLAYAAALAERAVEQHSFDVRIQLDDRVIDARVFNLIVNNVPVYAGELVMPESEHDDGLLDVYLFNRQEYASKLMSFIIRQADVLRLGVHEFLEEITQNQRTHHSRRVAFRLASPKKVQADGELLGESDEIECEILAALDVAIP